MGFQGIQAVATDPNHPDRPAHQARGESPVHRSLGAGALAVLNLGLKVGANIILVPVSLRYLGREEYGIWIILQTVTVYLTMSELGMGQTVVNFQGVAYARGDFREINRVLNTTFGFNWLLVLPLWFLLTALIYALPVEVLFLGDPGAGVSVGFRHLLFLTGTLVLFRVPLQILASTLLGLRELILRQVIDGAYSIFLVLGTVITLAAGGRLLALTLVLNLGFSVIMLSSYWVARRRHPALKISLEYFSRPLLWPLLANSILFLLYNLGLFFQRLAGNLLAGKLGPLAELPEFFVLLMIFRVAGWSLVEIPSQTLVPYIIKLPVEGRFDRVVFFSKLCTKFTFTLALCYAALVWIFAQAGIRLWLGPGMFLGFGPLACLGASFLIDVLFLTTNNFMRGLNCHRGLAFVMAGYAALSFVFGIIGARWWMPQEPLYGLCWGLLAASLLGQGVPLAWLSSKWIQTGWRHYSNHFLVRPALLAVCTIAATIGLSSVGEGAFWEKSLQAVLLSFGPAFLAWLWVLDTGERAWLAALARRIWAGEKPAGLIAGSC